MRDELLALYHRLPPSARSAAATMRGMYLRHWRYGPATERLVEETLERDTWGEARWERWRQDTLSRTLHRAATQVPFYREHWARRRRAGDQSSSEVLENWPILEKDVLRENPRAFVADDCDPRKMFHEQTSGTTGKPLDIWRKRETVECLYALTEARTDRWYGLPRGARWARLGGQLVTPVRQRRPPFWVWNAAMRQLYMSTYHLAPDLIPFYLDALVEYQVVHLAAYPSSLLALAHEVLRLGRTDLKMMCVVTNAEPLSQEQRAIIGEAFQCPVRETYGMTETVAGGSECAFGRLHEWPEVGVIEVLQDGRQASPGETGELVCTGLLNPDMPFIRYRVGDRGSLADPAERCACGRTLPLMGAVEGRSTDMLVTRDGRQVFWLNPVFYGLPVRQSQIIQEELDRVTVRVAPGVGFGQNTLRTIVDRLKDRMGDVNVETDVVAEVPRTSNGKLQAVVCRLSKADRDAAIAVARGKALPASAGGTLAASTPQMVTERAETIAMARTA